MDLSKFLDVAKIMAIVVMVNTGLAFLKAGLDAIKDKTEATWDNKAADLVGTILGIVSKVIDILSANVAHKK